MNQTYQVNAYALRGSTALDGDATRGALTNAIGPAVPLSRICKTVAQLRLAYLERGITNVVLSVPAQRMDGGVVYIDVRENAPSQAARAETKRPPAARFEIRQIAVTGNTILSSDDIAQNLASAIGPAVTLEEVRAAAENLQRAYRERGFVTVVPVGNQQLLVRHQRLNAAGAASGDLPHAVNHAVFVGDLGKRRRRGRGIEQRIHRGNAKNIVVEKNGD